MAAKAKTEEKTAVEEFMEKKGSDLVIAPNALGAAKRMRAFALLVGMTNGLEGDEVELDYADVLNGTADAVEWIAENAAKDSTKFMDFFNKLSIEDGMEYVMSYLSAVGEM